LGYADRFYRQSYRQSDLIHFQVAVAETDLNIGVRKGLYTDEFAAGLEQAVRAVRRPLEEYIRKDPDFVWALKPHRLLPDAPEIARVMAEAAEKAGVGPMAAVAGAIAEAVGKPLVKLSRDVIVENGGDIFLSSGTVRRVGIFAGESALSGRVALEVRPEETPLGICTSSGKVGPSLSFGKTDAVVILSRSAALADAVATACGNIVQTADDLEKALDLAAGIDGVKGAVIIIDGRLAARGKVKLVPN